MQSILTKNSQTINMPKDYKDFKDVRIGDIATDYMGEQYPVVDMGPAGEMIKKYPSNPFNVEDFEDVDGVDEFDPAIVVEEKQPLGIEKFTHCVYVYGYEGAIVKL